MISSILGKWVIFGEGYRWVLGGLEDGWDGERSIFYGLVLR